MFQTHSYQPIPSTEEENSAKKSYNWKSFLSLFFILFLLLSTLYKLFTVWNSHVKDFDSEANFYEATIPFSTLSPVNLGVVQIVRSLSSMPSDVFGDLRNTKIPLPTNSWCENFFLGKGYRTDETNKVFQLPYVIEAHDYVKGVKTHPVRVQSNDRTVMMIYEPENGLALGAMETFLPQHEIAPDKNLAIGRLSVVLQWKSSSYKDTKKGPMMYTPIVRGSPYTSMVYSESTPRIYVQRSISGSIEVDNDPTAERLICGNGHNIFSDKPVLVKKELRLQFDISDMTWLVFVSEPTEFICSSKNLSNFVHDTTVLGWEVKEPHFELRAVRPMKKGMVRVAIVNNCTTGMFHAQLCDKYREKRNTDDFTALIRRHSDVYASGNADIQFQMPRKSTEEDELSLRFDWAPDLMSRISLLGPDQFTESGSKLVVNPALSSGVELLMYAIPHHRERMTTLPDSTNQVLNLGCTPTLHGIACPVIGNRWALLEHLHRVSFAAPRPPRPEMLPAIRSAVEADIDYKIPFNYQIGAGDTYFSGKMLAKLARILVVADEVGYDDKAKFNLALGRLRAGVEIWLNTSAISPFLYDSTWGGLVMCGCDFDGSIQNCRNRYPDCPALVDFGQNFGAGFYNDHHFHYGYHIYAAAVIAKFDHDWAKAYFEHVLMLIRDIANPSPDDPFFPAFRHKDWYLGFSWASGIVVTGQGNPYPNGRNQESISESINGYEAISLYGDVMSTVFAASDDARDISKLRVAERVADMGRLLFATETRSAKTYWHVQSPNTAGVARIYPELYTPKVVGMVWSLLAQEQTWFGNEPYKSYGIQLMPVTGATELRDSPGWVEEMLPFFNSSCAENPGCAKDGWSILVFVCEATVGRWEMAWKHVEELPDEAYLNAGGNGHSKSNTLYHIATRPNIA